MLTLYLPCPTGAVWYDHTSAEDPPQFQRPCQCPPEEALSRPHQNLQAHQWGTWAILRHTTPTHSLFHMLLIVLRHSHTSVWNRSFALILLKEEWVFWVNVQCKWCVCTKSLSSAVSLQLPTSGLMTRKVRMTVCWINRSSVCHESCCAVQMHHRKHTCVTFYGQAMHTVTDRGLNFVKVFKVVFTH